MGLNEKLKFLIVAGGGALFLACYFGWDDGGGPLKSKPSPDSSQPAQTRVVERLGPAIQTDRRPPASTGTSPQSSLRRHRVSSVLGCGLELSIRVGGAPLEGAVADASLEDGSSYQSDPSGREGQIFLDVPCGGQAIEVSATGYVPVHFRTELSPESLFYARVVELQPAHRRSGLVLDEARRPIAGAAVSLTPLDRGSEGLVRRVATRRDGSYDIDLASGTERLRASKEGFQSYSAVVDADAVWNPAIVLKREEPGGRFRGVVAGRDGRPIPGATLLLRDQKDALDSRSGRTMPDGRFDFPAPAGTEARLVVSAEGCLDLRQPVDLGRGGEHRFVLDCYPTFVVKVLDPDGNAIQTPRIAGASPSTGEPLVNCSPQGRCYSVEYPVRLQAAALGSGLGLTAPVVVPAYTPEIELRMESAGALKGVVEDQQGRAIRSFTVQLREPMFVSQRFDSEDGSFRLESFPSGEAVVAVAAPGYRPLTRRIVTSAAAGAVVQRWRLAPLPPELKAWIP